MKRIAPVIALTALALSGCKDDPPAPLVSPAATTPARSASPGPDLARCDAQHVQHPIAPLPADPVAIPKAFRAIVKASAFELALVTQAGTTICENNVGTNAVSNMAWLREDRLLGWKWEAHEAFGYAIFDRTGKGTVIETGVRPVFSPGGTRLAAVEFSDFGALGGFAVWEVRADETVQIGGETSRSEGEGADFVVKEPAVFTDRIGDWRIAGWKGETCVNIAFDGQEPPSEASTVSGRQAFHAAESASWRIAPGWCP